jgi:serine/threonine protein kinase
MLEAVHAVHLENVVHTDLKPANFVLVKGRLKIIDFGIAKAIANDTVNIQRDMQVSRAGRMALILDRYCQLHVPRGDSADEQSEGPEGELDSIITLTFSFLSQVTFGHSDAFYTR